jgi:hypothetical protein
LSFWRLLLKSEKKKKKKEAKELEQQKKVFKTKCKVQGKCCNLIIDGGSRENLVSTEVMNKLNLTRLNHSNPYLVSWLNKGH